MKTKHKILYPAQTETRSYGKLQVYVNCQMGARPVDTATVRVFQMGNPNVFILEVDTNISGYTPIIELPAPPLIYSLEPSALLPYAEYAIQVIAPGLKTVEIFGIQVFPTVTAIQPVLMPPMDTTGLPEIIIIEPHTLTGNYPPQVYEDEIKLQFETGLPVVIPEFIVIHNGVPSDYNAINICERYIKYIKNVVSNEIYPTWPIETIYANILATLSFTLNRMYTNWYPNQGYSFNITSSNAFDNKWVYGRNYYQNISLAVDAMFNLYLPRPDIIQPILTQYCKGELVYCENMMEKWISKDLGDMGYDAIQILRHFYGESIHINSSNLIADVETPYPGFELTLGSTGNEVSIIQEQLSIISKVYSEIPGIDITGTYDDATTEAVKAYQKSFGLPVTGTVDFATWYHIAFLYARYTNRAAIC
jgi:peptidoglycan hydrolase-like protein with peptidoglycan-binding domain